MTALEHPLLRGPAAPTPGGGPRWRGRYVGFGQDGEGDGGKGGGGEDGGVIASAFLASMGGPPVEVADPVVIEVASDPLTVGAHRRLRQAVFVVEQGLFAEAGDDQDAADDDAATIVLVARRRDTGDVVGGVRVHPVDASIGWWQGSRLVVDAAGSGDLAAPVGSRLVRAAMALADDRGALRFDATVQATRRRWFERLGWVAMGPVEVPGALGVEHVLMRAPCTRFERLVADTKAPLGRLLAGFAADAAAGARAATADARTGAGADAADVDGAWTGAGAAGVATADVRTGAGAAGVATADARTGAAGVVTADVRTGAGADAADVDGAWTGAVDAAAADAGAWAGAGAADVDGAWTGADDGGADAGVRRGDDVRFRSGALGGLGFVGDDGAPVPGSDLVAACDAIVPAMVERDPEWAGWCAVLVNVNDLAAMGAEPVGLLDAVAGPDEAHVARVLDGMRAAAAAYGVPVLGGHTQLGVHASASITALGRAPSSGPVPAGGGRAGDVVHLVADLGGGWRPGYTGRQWDSTSHRAPEELRSMVGALRRTPPAAAKDVSMAGLVGTLAMLAEASGTGAVVDVASVPRPDGAALADWLTCFPGFGLLTADRPGVVPPTAPTATTAPIGELTTGTGVQLRWPDGRTTPAVAGPATGLGPAQPHPSGGDRLRVPANDHRQNGGVER